MFCSRYLLPILAFYLFIDELYAFLLPDRLRFRRDTNRLDQDLPPFLSELSDLTDLFPPDAGVTTRDWGSRHSQHSNFHTPLESRLNGQVQNNHRHKPKDKRRRVTAPLDPIGGSFLSLRSRKDEPEESWERHAE